MNYESGKEGQLKRTLFYFQYDIFNTQTDGQIEGQADLSLEYTYRTDTLIIR